MCYRLRLFFLACTLCSLPLVIGGCNAERTQTTALAGAEASAKLGAMVPIEYKVYPAIITAGLTLIAAVAGLIKERRKSKAMKEAILAKADQIDKLALSAAAATENPGNIVTKFMKADARTRPPAEKKALNHFDAVRKGYV